MSHYTYYVTNIYHVFCVVAESCQFPVCDWNSKWDLSSSTICNPNRRSSSPISLSRLNQDSEFAYKPKLQPVKLDPSYNYQQYEGQWNFDNIYTKDISTDFTARNYGKVNNWTTYSENCFSPAEYAYYPPNPPTNRNEFPQYLTNSFVQDECNDFCISNCTKLNYASRNWGNNLIEDQYDSSTNQVNQYDWNRNSTRNVIKNGSDEFCGTSSQFKVSDCFPSSNSLWCKTPLIIKEDYSNDIAVLETHYPNIEHKINFYNSSLGDSYAGRQILNEVSEISNDSVELLFERAGLQDLMQTPTDELLQSKEFDELIIDDQPLKKEIKQENDDSGREINTVTFNRKHYTCTNCAFNTNGRERLAEHIDRLHSNSGYNMRSTRRRRLRNYIDKENFEAKEPRIKSKEKSFKCSECTYTTNHSERLKKHIEKKHFIENRNRYNSWDQDLKCEPPAMANRTLNQKTKSGSKLHKCNECNYKAPRHNSLMKHIEKIHSKNVCYSCSLCNFVSTYNREYYAHMKCHFAGPPFRCEACSYKSKNITAFIAHRVTHTGERPFNCTLCAFCCKRKYHLKGHMISHSKEKNFKCDYCTKKYSYKCSQVRHQKTCKKKTSEEKKKSQ